MKNITKIIATILVSYSLLAGMLIPLGAGIYRVSPSSVEAGGNAVLMATFYNTNLTEEAAINARLRLAPDKAVCMDALSVVSDRELAITFKIPNELPELTPEEKSAFPYLEVYNKTDDSYATLESAVFITPSGKRDSIAANYCELSALQSDKVTFPFLNILQETIRNLYFHVPMWFGMLLIMFMSVVYSIRYLSNPQNHLMDIKANSFASVGLLFGFIGITTGALWAKHTWGAYWSFDTKQNTSAIALLIYMGLFVLRSSIDNVDTRAKVSAVFNIFAFAMLIPLLYILPRMYDSLHPGATGNPGFNTYDLDSTMRMVFYPAVIGWMMMGFWLTDIKFRVDRLFYKMRGDVLD